MLALKIQGQVEYLPDDELDDALRRYWTARSGGDTTAEVTRIEVVESKKEEEPEPEPPPTPAGVVSPLAYERVELHDRLLKDAGFGLPPPIFAPGTRVMKVGDENFRVERRRVEELPSFPEAAERLRTQIQLEAREDLRVPLDTLFMNEAGRLVLDGVDVALEVDAFAQLALLTGIGAGTRYLRDLCPPSLRATNVNYQVTSATKRDLVLRTRQIRDCGRQAFAVVTPTYSVVDTDEVLQALEPSLHDARVEVVYDGTGVRATALWMPDQILDLAAGDVFKVGVRVQTDDTGRGRIRIAGVAFRNLCLNLIVVAEGQVETVSLVHRGDPGRILTLLQDGVERARESVGAFLTAWGHARTVKVDPRETLRVWVEERRVLPSLRDREGLHDVLLHAWSHEPGETLADCVNALTRAAHEAPSWSQTTREELERGACELVYLAA